MSHFPANPGFKRHRNNKKKKEEEFNPYFEMAYGIAMALSVRPRRGPLGLNPVLKGKDRGKWLIVLNNQVMVYHLVYIMGYCLGEYTVEIDNGYLTPLGKT